MQITSRDCTQTVIQMGGNCQCAIVPFTEALTYNEYPHCVQMANLWVWGAAYRCAGSVTAALCPHDSSCLSEAMHNGGRKSLADGMT